MRSFLVSLCVAAAAGTAWAGSALKAPPADLSGRWEGDSHSMSGPEGGCDGGQCPLRLDIVACGETWCGIEVAKDGGCGGKALELKAITEEGVSPGGLEGKLQLASGTEPYVIHAYVSEADSAGQKDALHMTGDTGGEFRFWRRSFPFHATLARTGDAICKDLKPVS